jgi:hypothetical protein
MVNFGVVIILLLAVSVILSLYKLFKSGITTKRLLSFGASLLIFIAGLILYFDTANFAENFESSQKIFLLDHKGNIVAGFEGTLTPNTQPSFFTDAKIAEYNKVYQQQDYETLKGERFKLFIMTAASFLDMEEVTLSEVQFSQENMFTMMESSEAMNIFVEGLVDKEKLPARQLDSAREQYLELVKDELTDTSGLRSHLFGKMVTDQSTEHGSFFFLREFKRGNMLIHEETAMFRVIKLIPEGILRMLSGPAAQ